MYKGEGDQQIQEVLNGTPVTMRFKWNTRFKFWALSIYTRENMPIVTGIKLVRDYPLLDRLRLDTLRGDLVVARLFGAWDYPEFTSLPEEMAIVWLDPDDIEAVKNGIV